MSEKIRACLFDASSQPDAAVGEAFDAASTIEIVGTFDDWDALDNCVRGQRVQVVGVKLDDEGGQGLQIVERIVAAAPTLGIIGVSGNSDPQSIIAAMRAGCHQFVCTPIDVEDLNKAINAVIASVQARQQSAEPDSRSKRICVIGSSGGAGATTIACNLAVELAHMTNRTCALVDMNLEFGDVGCVFDCNPKFSLYDVCHDDVQVDRLVLGNAIHELPCKVALLTRPERLDDAHAISPEGIQVALNVLGEMYPFTVVDLPRIYSFLSAAAVAEADHILIVTQLSVPHIRNATRIHECLMKMGASSDHVDIVLNRFKANFERITPDEVEAHFKRPVFAMIPNDYRRVQTSLDLGHPILSDGPYNSPIRAATQEMARKITATPQDAPEAVAAGSPSGLLGRWWKRGAK